MTKIIECTVAEIPAAFAEAGVPDDAWVIAKVYSPEEAAKLRELRRLVQEGLDSGEAVDANETFARLRAEIGEDWGTSTP